MAEAGRRESAADGLATDLVEASTLEHRIGEEVRGVVVKVLDRRVRVQIRDPAVVADVATTAPLGTEVRLRVAAADVEARTVTFEALR
jgi:exoribonuclease R